MGSWKDLRKDLGRELYRAWENVTDGWREMVSTSANALTHFVRSGDDGDDMRGYPNWGLLAGEVRESSDAIIVRVEIPGIEKEDCRIRVEHNRLRVSGQKRVDREHVAKTYYLRECAYGHFEREFELPAHVDPALAEASFKNGVVTVMLPKTGRSDAHEIPLK